eukprot:5172668-Pyramimonas_sp.AAC.1
MYEPKEEEYPALSDGSRVVAVRAPQRAAGTWGPTARRPSRCRDRFFWGWLATSSSMCVTLSPLAAPPGRHLFHRRSLGGANPKKHSAHQLTTFLHPLLQVTLQDETYFIQVGRYNNSGIEWAVAVAMSKNEMLGSVLSTRRSVIILSIVLATAIKAFAAVFNMGFLFMSGVFWPTAMEMVASEGMDLAGEVKGFGFEHTLSKVKDMVTSTV